MTRTGRPVEPDTHARFTTWLANGAGDAPARDLALHGAFCPECRAGVAALDLLQLIDTGRAPIAPSRPAVANRRSRTLALGIAGAASAGLLVAAVAGWTLQPTSVPVAAATPSPAQEVLGGMGGGELASPTPRDSKRPDKSTGPTATNAPSTPVPTTFVQPVATPLPSERPRSARPVETDTPGPSQPPRGTMPATASPTPTPAPLDDCADGVDNDGDTLIDLLDPGCLLDGNEPSA